MRRCAAFFGDGFSGDTSVIRLAKAFETRALSRAFSVRAAWAVCIACEVPALEVMLGDCGFKGNGGGALSGSELSHLSSIRTRGRRKVKPRSITYMGIRDRLWSDEAEC